MNAPGCLPSTFHRYRPTFQHTKLINIGHTGRLWRTELSSPSHIWIQGDQPIPSRKGALARSANLLASNTPVFPNSFPLKGIPFRSPTLAPIPGASDSAPFLTSLFGRRSSNPP